MAATPRVFPSGLVLNNKLKSLKQLLMSSLVHHTSEGPRPLTRTPSDSDALLRGEIGIELFNTFMQSCDLHHLACRQVFDIFDINQDGKIELKEFLLVCLFCECFQISVPEKLILLDPYILSFPRR
jgi:hypothetical protein